MSSFCVICSSPMMKSLPCGMCGHVGSKRAGSMYGGAGGFGVRISQATSGCAEVSDLHGIGYINDNKKATMKNLNNRLETYLETVSSLKTTNEELELKIKKFQMDKPKTDLKVFEVTIHDIQEKISKEVLDNTKIQLDNDNVKLDSHDWKVKYESELSMRQCVEADIAALKIVQEELDVGRSSVELQDLEEELKRLHEHHEEDMRRQGELGSQVKVDVHAAPQDDLAKVMVSMREHYEKVITQNRQEVELWFKTKTDKLDQEVKQTTEIIDLSKSEIIKVRRELHSLEIQLQAEISKKACQVNVLEETKCGFANLLAGYQRQVCILEEQLTLLRADLENQAQDKTKLEMEIAEYRRLLNAYLENIDRNKKITTTETTEKEITTEKKDMKTTTTKTTKEEVTTEVNDEYGHLLSTDTKTTKEEVTTEVNDEYGHLLSTDTKTTKEEVTTEVNDEYGNLLSTDTKTTKEEVTTEVNDEYGNLLSTDTKTTKEEVTTEVNDEYGHLLSTDTKTTKEEVTTEVNDEYGNLLSTDTKTTKEEVTTEVNDEYGNLLSTDTKTTKEEVTTEVNDEYGNLLSTDTKTTKEEVTTEVNDEYGHLLSTDTKTTKEEVTQG